MDLKKFEYATIHFSPDRSSGETLNIGFLASSLDGRYFAVFEPGDWRRIAVPFGDQAVVQATTVLQHLAQRFESEDKSPRKRKDQSLLSAIIREYPDKGLSLQFGPILTASSPEFWRMAIEIARIKLRGANLVRSSVEDVLEDWMVEVIQPSAEKSFRRALDRVQRIGDLWIQRSPAQRAVPRDTLLSCLSLNFASSVGRTASVEKIESVIHAFNSAPKTQVFKVDTSLNRFRQAFDVEAENVAWKEIEASVRWLPQQQVRVSPRAES